MNRLLELWKEYGSVDCGDLSTNQKTKLRDALKDQVQPGDIQSLEAAQRFITLVRKFRESLVLEDRLKGANYPELLRSLLSVGENGLYSNDLRFVFELIQNVDDVGPDDGSPYELEMRFDFNADTIQLTYNEAGFTPFNVFAITGIAEAAKNVQTGKSEIGEKGIGFKSVFGVADRVWIRSGWFSFELHKDNFTIPVLNTDHDAFCKGTVMTLYLGQTEGRQIYRKIRDEYCSKEALFSRNPLLFLNRLTRLNICYDSWRHMDFRVSHDAVPTEGTISKDTSVYLSVDLSDADHGKNESYKEEILCVRYTYPVKYSKQACASRYGANSAFVVGGGKKMMLQAIFPYPDYISQVGKGALYSFLPTQLKFNAPVVCHVPFKLDASREFVDPEKNNAWFNESTRYLSALLDYAYQDWCHEIKEDILRYLPASRASIIAVNNGKEKCLSDLPSLRGEHFLELPLLSSPDGAYHPAKEVMCFDGDEDISEPEKVHDWLGLSKAIFIPPKGINTRMYAIRTDTGVLDQLFQHALNTADHTAEILEYLSQAKYDFKPELLRNHKKLVLTETQLVSISHHKPLLKAFQEVARQSIQKSSQPPFNAAVLLTAPIGEQFSFSYDEAPQRIESYLNHIRGLCSILPLGDSEYLPLGNVVILDKDTALPAFAALCSDVDSKSAFALRIKLREFSRNLDRQDKDESITDVEYLKKLREVRKVLKDTLGDTGYRSYIDLILHSGMNDERFLHELLQNADDCTYPEDATPEFRLTTSGNRIITEYNEVGFTRAHVRAITAIGESTKNKLLSGSVGQIGEKGVGFKSIFARASNVDIHSGGFHFALKAKEPTVPELIKSDAAVQRGTRMEITLNPGAHLPAMNEKALLELCLCLRNLKKLTINGTSIQIEDDEHNRYISVNRKRYEFLKFVHHFIVNDQAAIEERRHGLHEVSAQQKIVCYVPESNKLPEYSIYAGLPTSHKLKIPLAVDAPFSLTTSREEISTSEHRWNDIVRREMHLAIVKVIDELKVRDRIEVLRFTNFRYQMTGNHGGIFVNDLSDLEYIRSFDYIALLKQCAIIPTYNEDTFVRPGAANAHYFPEVAVYCFSNGQFGSLATNQVIDAGTKFREGKSQYDSALRALGCNNAPFDLIYRVIRTVAEAYVSKPEFAQLLYDYLSNTPESFRDSVRQLKIIPVYGSAKNSICYVSWVDDHIFVKKDAHQSTQGYLVLNEELLSKATCERIFSVSINEMNEAWEHQRYCDNLRGILKKEKPEKVYRYLLQEFNNGNLKNNQAKGTLLVMRQYVALKNQLGEIVDRELFITDKQDGYFYVPVIQKIAVAKECKKLAEYLDCDSLTTVHYDDFEHEEALTEDDIECLTDDYFVNREEILRGFYHSGQLDESLLPDEWMYILAGRTMEESRRQCDFPSVPVKDMNRLRKHIKDYLKNPIQIVERLMERKERWGLNESGGFIDLRSADLRKAILDYYTPEDAPKMCFCQMCRKLKPHRAIEVRNLELLPKFHYPPSRVALCLECSKDFESYRNNSNIRENYLNAIRTTYIGERGTIEISVSDSTHLTFTGVHLAEIQELFRQR